MARPENEGSFAGIKRIIGVVVPLVLVILLGMHQANFVAGRALLLAFGDLESTYESAWPTLGGDVTASNVVVYLPDLPEEAALRFETMRVETPGFFWYAISMFKKDLPEAGQLTLNLEGATSPAAFDYTMGSLGIFGVDSASPFEAEGCARDSLWETAELRDMGLDPGPTRVSFDWKVEGRLLTVTEEVSVPNVSTVRYRRLEQMAEGRTNIVVLDYSGDSQVMSDRWEVEDAGFVAARNKHCAKRDGISRAQFPDRHVAAVLRRLEAEGLAVGPDAIARYQAFAEKGGRISMGGQYQFAMSYSGNYSNESWTESLPSLAALVDHDGRASPWGWRLVEARPLAEDDEATTWELMQREGFQFPTDTAVAGATDVAAQPSADAAVVGATGVATRTLPGTSVVGATGVATRAPTEATPSASPTTSETPPVGAAIAATKAPPTTTPPVVAAPSPPPVEPPAQPKPIESGDEIPYDKLSEHIGWYLQFNTTNGKHRRAELVRADKSGVEIRVRYASGWASYSIGRTDLISTTVP